MEAGREADDVAGRSSQWFATTQWSVVILAGSETSDASSKALEQLLSTYWPPLYAFVRRRGYSPDDARDLVQAFLGQLIGRERLKVADPARGRFRSFLLCSFTHFLANQAAANRALKRGGGNRLLPLDGPAMEARYQAITPAEQSPERAFDHQWAMVLLEVVLDRLRREQEDAGSGEVFEWLKPWLEGDEPEAKYHQVAARLSTTTNAVKMRAMRLRRRYRELIKEEIARTLADPSLASQELQALLAVLREG